MTSFALQPDLQFKYFLAAELHMTVRELSRDMDCVEYHWWGVHFLRKADAEQKAMEKAKRKSKGRGTF